MCIRDSAQHSHHDMGLVRFGHFYGLWPHIVVAVLGEEEKLLERGMLFTKAMAVCCKQKYATGV